MPGRKPLRPTLESFDPSCCDRTDVLVLPRPSRPPSLLPLKRLNRFKFEAVVSPPDGPACPSPPVRPRELRNASAHAARFTALSAVRRPNCERVLAAPLSPAMLRFVRELPNDLPTEERLRDPPLPDDESP